MSLSQPVKPTFRIGIIASVAFDHEHWLADRFGAHLDQIEVIYTNGVNQRVVQFAQTHGIPYMVYPPTHGRSVLWSNNRVIEQSGKVYILTTPDSKNGKQAEKTCQEKGVQHELIDFEPVTYWKERVCRAQEIVAAADKKDLAENETLKALKGVL